MRILLFGSSGQVARAVQAASGAVGAHLTIVGRDALDLASPHLDKGLIASMAGHADAIINAAAYTAVDKAEDEPEIARRLNADAPGIIAQAAARAGIPMLHLSTDYVFDGSGNHAWRPEDQTAPLGIYGLTKRDGEVAVHAAGARHVILRTSWVFSATGANFVRSMVRLGAERSELSVVSDQIGGPTPAIDIAAVLLTIAQAMVADPEMSGGTYHFSGAPDVSWAEFAAAIMRYAGLDCAVRPIPGSAYPTAAARPLNSRLDCRRTEVDFGIPRPDWRTGLQLTLEAMGYPAESIQNEK